MKIIYFIIIASLAFGCKENNKKEIQSLEEKETKQSDTSTSSKSNHSEQKGNYVSLFENPDCNVITAEEISNALGITFTNMNTKNMCSFQSQFKNKPWYVSIIKNTMKQSEIEKEIQVFKSDQTGQLKLIMSENGDTYLCNQHNQGYLTMYNQNYASSIGIRYGSIGESRAFTKEERLEHRDFAIQLANAILAKHRK